MNFNVKRIGIVALLAAVLAWWMTTGADHGVRAGEDEKPSVATARAAAEKWLAGVGKQGLVMEERMEKVGFVGQKIVGSQAVMFIFQQSGWHITLGFSESVSSNTPLQDLRSRFKYIALDRVPTPGLAVSGWDIKPQTPVSSFKEGVEISGWRNGIIRLKVKTSFFALYGVDPSVRPPADAPMPASAYFQIRQAFPLELTLEAPLAMGNQ